MAENRPLHGTRVFELALGIAGPLAARYLANFGAEVIKVESANQPDNTRTVGPGWLPREKHGNRVWMDCSAMANEYNCGKLSVGLNLKSTAGMGAARKLLSHCDVFISNYSPEALGSLGLDYQSLCTVRPDIIHLSLSGFGATPETPYYRYLAWGPNLTALCGLEAQTGLPEGPLLGIAATSYSDFASAALAAFAALAAINYRTRTGQGQAIDLSQFEAVVALLGTSLLDFETNGRAAARNGNRSSWAAPQGVYRCRGWDRWVATSVTSASEWQAFCKVVGHPEWLIDPRFATVENRLAHHDELDALIAAWTLQHSPPEVAARLQCAGVAASPVMNHPELAMDPQLAARDFWLLLDHARCGKDIAPANPIHLSGTPGGADWATPSLGEHNRYVLGELCGYSQDEIAGMVADGVVFPMDQPGVQIRRRYVPWIRHLMPHLPWSELDSK